MKCGLGLVLVFIALQCLPGFAQQQTLQIRGALSIGFGDGQWSDQRTYGGITPGPAGSGVAAVGSSINMPVGTKWTLMLGGADPNVTFAFCVSKDDAAWPCAPRFGTTDQFGNWTQTGVFDASVVGSWTEWAQFPSGATSNRIVFAVAGAYPSAVLTINNADLGVFHVGQPWILQMTNAFGHYLEPFDLCAEIGGSSVSCSTGAGVVDGNGDWSMTSSFSNDVVGGWSLWARFSNGTTSNRIAFTVDTAPLDDLTCENGTIYPTGPNAGLAGFRRYIPDWKPSNPGDYAMMSTHPGGIGNTLEYLGCKGANYVWMQWAYDAFMAFGVRAPWGGQTDRGLRIGDDLAHYQSLYPAGHHPTPMYGLYGWQNGLDVWLDGPLVVMFQNGNVSMIGVDWSLFLLYPTDDQQDTMATSIGPWDIGFQWYPWI